MANRAIDSSNFSGPFGIGALGIGAIISCYFEIYSLGGTLFFLMLIFFFAWLWGRYALSKLEVHMPGGEWSGFPEEKIRLVCKVKNAKLLPLLWLEMGFPIPKNRCVEKELSRKFSYVRWHEELEFAIQGKASRRGVAQYDAITAASGDGFGLGEKEKDLSLEMPVRITVYPSVFPVETGNLLRSFSEIQQGEKGYLEDVSLLKMNRAYEPQDSAKKINWRQLAGGGKLTTNIYETMLPRTITFVLDLMSFRVESEEETDSSQKVWKPLTQELEAMLSLVASCVMELTKDHASCRIAIPGGTEKLEEMQYSQDRTLDGLLSQLAEVEYEGEKRKFTEEDVSRLEAKTGIKLIVARDWDSFSGKEIFIEDSRNVVFLAMQASLKDEDCPWKRMYAEEFICRDGGSE